MLFIKGLTLTTPIHAALLILITPVFILLFAFVLRSEKITLLKITGLLLSITGAALLILSKENSTLGADMFLGDVLVIINAVSYAFYFVLVKPLIQKYSPLHVIRWVFTFGLFMITPFCWGQLAETNWTLFAPSHYAAIAFIVLGATFFAYLFTVYGLNHLSASSAGSYIYLQPFFSAIFSYLLFGESLTVYKIIAAALIFSGVYFINKKSISSIKLNG